ncbi:flagellar protein FliT [Billgrantia gudaonensis]|nr:flagellar protein FliT [Halomonas gudaonensis]
MSEASGPDAVIAGYRRLRSLAAEMLALANEADWDALIERQQGYLEQMDRLKALDAACELPAGHAAIKAELLEAILADDLVIRRQLMARRDELGLLIDRSRRQRDLQRTYGRQGTSPGDGFGQGSP